MVGVRGPGCSGVVEVGAGLRRLSSLGCCDLMEFEGFGGFEDGFWV